MNDFKRGAICALSYALRELERPSAKNHGLAHAINDLKLVRDAILDMTAEDFRIMFAVKGR